MTPRWPGYDRNPDDRMLDAPIWLQVAALVFRIDGEDVRVLVSGTRASTRAEPMRMVYTCPGAHCDLGGVGVLTPGPCRTCGAPTVHVGCVAPKGP